MSPDEYLPIVISSFSLILSCFVFWRTKKYNTSDFKLSQKVKKDTLDLLSTLRSLQIKAVLVTQGEKNLTTVKEKERINNFLQTSTAFAYMVWVGQIGQKNKTIGKGSGKLWRTFFYRLIRLLSNKNIISMGYEAVELENLFETLKEKDFKIITSYLQDIPDALQKRKKFKKYDPLIQAFTNHHQERRESTVGLGDTFEKKISYLKNKGIIDPDIDLFFGVFSGDKNIIKKAIDDGANLSTTDIELIKRYEIELKDFNK